MPERRVPEAEAHAGHRFSADRAPASVYSYPPLRCLSSTVHAFSVGALPASAQPSSAPDYCVNPISARLVLGGSPDFHVSAPAGPNPVVPFLLRETFHDLARVSQSVLLGVQCAHPLSGFPCRLKEVVLAWNDGCNRLLAVFTLTGLPLVIRLGVHWYGLLLFSILLSRSPLVFFEQDLRRCHPRSGIAADVILRDLGLGVRLLPVEIREGRGKCRVCLVVFFFFVVITFIARVRRAPYHTEYLARTSESWSHRRPLSVRPPLPSLHYVKGDAGRMK